MILIDPEFIAAVADAVVARIPKPESPATKPPARLVDGNELARQIGVSLSFVEKLRADGTIPSILVGSSRRYDVDDVVAVLKARN